MKWLAPLILALVLYPLALTGQHTFSIVAVDPSTGEVGSAGATCLSSSDCGGCGGAIVISGIVPGRGAINAQATVCLPNSNLNYGLNQLLQGDSAQQVLQDLLATDPCNQGDTNNRQYGIVDLDSNLAPRVASFTGSSALNYANHITGPNYSIQGNILISQIVLDSLEAGFNRIQGPLCEKLMTALLAARIPGADARCLSNGTSSKSAFIRVAKPSDPLNNLWMDLNVPQVPSGSEPIDSLKTLFDTFKSLNSLPETTPNQLFQVSPNPTQGSLRIDFLQGAGGNAHLEFLDVQGSLVGYFQPVEGSRSYSLELNTLAKQHNQLLFIVYRAEGIWQSQKLLLR